MTIIRASQLSCKSAQRDCEIETVGIRDHFGGKMRLLATTELRELRAVWAVRKRLDLFQLVSPCCLHYSLARSSSALHH